MHFLSMLFFGGDVQGGVRIASAALLLCTASFSHAQNTPACGVLAGDRPHYGPFDYRKANQQQKSLVEDAHFTPGVESLSRTKSSYFGEDIGYTLRVFPNHHRALLTIQRLADREKTDLPSHAEFSVACYFDRAVRYAPNDAIVRMLFADYLAKKAKLSEASQQLDEAIRLADDNPFTHFNAGLVFLDMKNYERALAQAHRAAELGFTRSELKDRLVAAGKWVEPQARKNPQNPNSAIVKDD